MTTAKTVGMSIVGWNALALGPGRSQYDTE
jgi:hypothetical protein